MQLLTRTHGISVSDKQQEYLEKKLQHLKKYAARVSDESSTCHVDIEKSTERSSSANIIFRVQFHLPRDNFHTEVDSTSFEEGVDLVFEKLRRHVKQYKEQKQ